MFSVGEGQVGVGPAGEARAAARLGVAAAPQPDRVLRRHDAVRLRVRVGAHADRVVAVRQPQVGPVRGYVGREGLSEAKVPEGEVCPCDGPNKYKAPVIRSAANCIT